MFGLAIDVLPCHCKLKACFKHECLGALCDLQANYSSSARPRKYNVHLDRPEPLLCPVLETLGVGTVRRHHGVQGGAAGAETLLLGLVSEVIQLREIERHVSS